jgi:ribonuclease HI
MVDDWLTVGPDHTATVRGIARLENILIDCGFSISDKRRIGQREVALGVLIDTSSMRLSFDPTQARGTRIMLHQQLQAFQSGKEPDTTLVRHLCGKLNWYAEVLQSGRLHLRSWWLYQRFGQQLAPLHRELLVSDTKWWIAILETWERSSVSDLSYRIWSADELLQPGSVYVVQSDASGPDGIGYHAGFLDDDEQLLYSSTWSLPLPSSSHEAELRALLVAIQRTVAILDNVVVLWISDSQSAVASINNPRPRVDSTYFPILSTIYHHCDLHKLALLALWVPREQNTYADYLSHLAAMLDREEVHGVVQSQPFSH